MENLAMRLNRLTNSMQLVHLAGLVVLFVILGVFTCSAGGSSQDKVRPDEKARLTAADVVGPDGIVYPNWTKCGVQGGIPEVEAVASVEDFGAKADDYADDSEALARACEAAGKKGGGAVLLGEGVYYLDRPVTIRHDNVVIKRAVWSFGIRYPRPAWFSTICLQVAGWEEIRGLKCTASPPDCKK
jgi:hypothetical protein